jgi:hypothetical protein
VSTTLKLAIGAAALLVAGGVAAAVALAWHGSSGASPVATNALRVSSSYRPPRGAVVVAGESGSRAVALAVGRGLLTATVLAPSGDPADGLHVSFQAGGHVIEARPCGGGCYTAAAPRSRAVEVKLGAGPPLTFRIPARARPATAIVKRATRVFRNLRSLVYVESLRSTPTVGLLTTWRMQAPDRVAYRIKGGASAVVVGNRRWDRPNNHAAWSRSPQVPKLTVPQPTWGNLTVNAHVLGTARVGGHPVWVVSFVNPSVPAWFTAWIDQKSYRTLRLRMTAASHFMFHRYVEFNKPLRVSPPA